MRDEDLNTRPPLGQTPRVYAPGSIVDEDEEVEGGPETDQQLAAQRDPRGRINMDEVNRVDQTGRESLYPQNSEPTPDEVAHQAEYETVHTEPAPPNYRDETYRQPGQPLSEGQSATSYDAEKEAVSDGRRFIPPENA